MGVFGLEERNVLAVRGHLRYDRAVVEKVALQGSGACRPRVLVVAEWQIVSGRAIQSERRGSKGPAAYWL